MITMFMIDFCDESMKKKGMACCNEELLTRSELKWYKVWYFYLKVEDLLLDTTYLVQIVKLLNFG